MTYYEYHIVPAPSKGSSARGLRSVEDKFAHALAEMMNEMGRNGWEFQRSETLPCEERKGLTSKTTNYHSMLVFRRPTAAPKPEGYVEPVALIEHRKEQRPEDEPADHMAPIRRREVAAE